MQEILSYFWEMSGPDFFFLSCVVLGCLGGFVIMVMSD